jgi:hypothetical protein
MGEGEFKHLVLTNLNVRESCIPGGAKSLLELGTKANEIVRKLSSSRHCDGVQDRMVPGGQGVQPLGLQPTQPTGQITGAVWLLSERWRERGAVGWGGETAYCRGG